MKRTRKRNAIHSGIGDNDDLFVKRPQIEDTTETFQYAARLRGKKRHDTMVYPELPFQYGISYTGETYESDNEKDYKLGVNAHPEKSIEYRVEQTKELPVKRMWEAQACFEAEVVKHNMEYAVKYKGHTGKKDKRTAEYAVTWKGQYTVKDLGDVKGYFTDDDGHYIGYSNGEKGWKVNGSHVDDVRNRSFFSGVVAKDMYKWDAYEASFTFKPILNDGAGAFSNTKRYNWSKRSFYNAPKWDDDIVGLIFQAQDRKNFYMMMWESDERIFLSGRSGNNLDGINITKNDGEFVNRQAVASHAGGANPTHAEWVDYCNNKGWGRKHYRIYKVTNGVMKRVNTTMHGSGKGWTMNNMHRVRLVTVGKNVKIYARTSPGASEFKMFDFNTSWGKGAFGMFNVSQAVQFYSIEVVQKKVLSGRVPTTGWSKSDAKTKTVANNATTYVKSSKNFEAKLPSGISKSRVTMMEIKGKVRSTVNGSISLPKMTGKIVVKAKDYTTYKSYSGRIPSSGWYEFDGYGSQKLTGNAQDFVRDKSGHKDMIIDSITGTVKSAKTGKLTIQSKTGSIIAKNNNAKDAGDKYKKCYVRCGIVTVTPDNINFKTGLMVFKDIATVFKKDYAEFFNRKDFVKKKTEYKLLKPVKRKKPKAPPVEESEGGCVIEDEVAKPAPVIKCLNEFDFDGKKLVMWSCEFPVEIETQLFEGKVFAYKGWTAFDPLKKFKPNKWTHYKLIPIEATINKLYDEIKWATQKGLDHAPAGTKVAIKTTEWYKGVYPADISNSGIVTTEGNMTSTIPPAPEHFWHPDATDTNDVAQRMPGNFGVIHYLLDAWSNHPDVVMWFKSNPKVTTDNVSRDLSTLAVEGRKSMPVIMTTKDTDTIVISCKEDPRFIPWSSGKYIGYGKVNGKRPFWGNGSGKADMINVSTRSVFFPSNLVYETLQGPFVDVYDTEMPDYPRIKFKVHTNDTLIDFHSDHVDAYVWYSDWYSKWVDDKSFHDATLRKVTQIESPLNLDPTDPLVSDDYNPDNTMIERIEVSSNNPFVKIWIEEDKGHNKGLLGTYYRFPLTSSVFQDDFQVKGDYREWQQVYMIQPYMTKIEIPIDHVNATILSVTVAGTQIPQSSVDGWSFSSDVLTLNGSAIKSGLLSIQYSTGAIINEFTLNDDKGSHLEVYVNGRLLDQVDYSFIGRKMIIKKEQLRLNDWVNVQSYEMNDMHDPTQRNYLGEKQYAQLDFQEDVPTQRLNPNTGDPNYEGSFCFNWGFGRPVGMDVKPTGFDAMSMFVPEDINFAFDIDMELVYPEGTPIDISNFTGTWKQWDQQSVIPPEGMLMTGNGPGNWHGPPEPNYPEVTNLRNQNSRSGWYNPKHTEMTDYDFRFKVQARHGDDDMYGAIFKFDPTTQNFYSFEWDGYWGMNPPSGGTGVNGMALYKNVCTNPQDAGTGDLSYRKTLLVKKEISWVPGTAQINEVKISTIGSKMKVWTNNTLQLEYEDVKDPFLKGAWGPVTQSQPDTYFWDFWMQVYKRVTYLNKRDFKKPHTMTVKRPVIQGSDPYFDIELDPTEMESKFSTVINDFCTFNQVKRKDIVSIEYHISNDTSEYPAYFKEFQKVRVLELSPANLAPDPAGKSSIQQAVERYGKFDPSKTITITKDIYANWSKYKIEDYDVLTFTPADCNASVDLDSDAMMNFVRQFKMAADKVVIFTHDTGSSSAKPRFLQLLKEFGFKVTTAEPYTAGANIVRVDNTFNYPYDLQGTIPITTSHWNQVTGATQIFKFAHEDRPWLSYVDNVYYSEAGHSNYGCAGEFKEPLSDNEMKIWINLICRIAQWKPQDKPVITKYGQSKVYSVIYGQYPAVGPSGELPIMTPEKGTIPDLRPPTDSNPNDGFTVSWNGYIYAPVSGIYKFKATVNDGFRMWVKGMEILSEWHITGNPEFFPEYEASIYLEGNKWHSLRANYFDNVGQALVRLHWALPGQSFERISPDYLTPYLGYKLFAQVKQATPLPWHPMIHNGYYYHEERESYLYATKTTQRKTPNAFHEMNIFPRPQQGSAIIVRDNQGNPLRKVTFYDSNFNLTLENKEVFNGNGFAKYYLNYKGIDKATVKVKRNGKTLNNNEYFFNQEESSIEFMETIGFDEELDIRYILLYSYLLDMNSDMLNGFVNKDVAKIRLHSNYDKAKMVNMEIIYEAAKETPFYRASEVTFNPLLTHNHTGFLYITEQEEQEVKDMKVNLSDDRISNNGVEKILLTVKVVDMYNNPCSNKPVSIWRDGKQLVNKRLTNEAGELYLYEQPKATAELISMYKVVCESIQKEVMLNYYVDNQKERYQFDLNVQKLSVMAGVNDESIIEVTLRDKNWNPVGQGKNIQIEKRDSKGNVTTASAVTDAYGMVLVRVNGLNESHGNIMVKVSYDMGFETAASYTHMKVIGG